MNEDMNMYNRFVKGCNFDNLSYGYLTELIRKATSALENKILNDKLTQ